MATTTKAKDYDYDGMTMVLPDFQPNILDKIKETAFDDSDIIIATYPKCGTTWMQEILYLVYTEGDFEGSDKSPLYARYSFLEMTKDNMSELDKCLAKPPPRLLKTHLSTKFFKKTLEENKTKFVVVFRNPKDMLVSYYNFYKIPAFDFPEDGTWEEFFERFQNDKIVHGNYFDMQLSWWAYRDDPRVFITTYENMQKDPEKVIQQVASHLGKKMSPNLVKKVHERTTFKSMKAHPMLNFSMFPNMKPGQFCFMRKGQVGDWKNYFTAEQREYVDNISKLRFEPEGLFLQDELH